MTLSTTPLVDIDLATPPLPPLAIGLEPKEVLQVAGEDRETDVRLDEVGVLAEDNVPVASPVQGGPHPVLAIAHLLHQVRGVCQECFEFIPSQSSVMIQGSLVLLRPILLPVTVHRLCPVS